MDLRHRLETTQNAKQRMEQELNEAKQMLNELTDDTKRDSTLEQIGEAYT